MSAVNPEKIGRYQILERVGRGGMGVLLRGIDPVLDREVAIKLMLLDFSEDAEQMRPRFYREARAAAKLQHPNIVTVFEFAEEGNTPYIVMEFLRGTSLQARMTSPVPLTLDEKLNVISQLCNALHYAHEQGVVHRDIKPANIFLLPDGSVKLLDFGVAKLATSTLTRQGDVLGSASYMSPEQVSGNPVDGRSDIFSTGVVLYELLANRKPFQADTLTAQVVKLLREDPPSLNEVAPGLPPQLVSAVKRALEKEPAARFQTAGDFARDLQWIRQGLQASSQGAAPLEETRFASPTQLLELQKHLDQDRLQAAAGTSTTKAVVRERKWVVPAIGVAAVAALVVAYLGGRLSERPARSDATTTSAPEATSPPTDSAGPATKAGGSSSAAADASLQVESVPAGAAIVVDGKAINQTTPSVITLSGAGPHRLRLSKPGFVTQEVTIVEADLRKGAVSYTLAPAEVVGVAVSIESPYPVEVWNGPQAVARASQSHKLRIAPGSRLRISSRDFLLNDSLNVASRAVDYQAPALGELTVLTRHETCTIKIGDQVLGFPPITRKKVAAGEYRIEFIGCPSGVNPPGASVTVPPGGAFTAKIF